MILNKYICFFKTLVAYSLCLLVCVVWGVPCFFLTLLPASYRHDNRLLFWCIDRLYKGLISGSLLSIDIQGADNLPEGPAIFIANHQSAFDIPLLGSLANGYPHVWYVLAYYAQMPILGFFAQRLGVSVERSSSGAAARSLVKGLRLVENHNRHTFLFPEGGRFVDGTVHSFLPGFAFIAKKTARPVIPVFLHSIGRVYPPGSFLINYCPITIEIGPAYYFKKDDTVETFTQRVYAWFDQRADKPSDKL